jgi:hypothetical protein
MAKYISEITPAQKERFGEWVDKWVAIGLSTEPADFETAIDAAKKAYQICELPQPKVFIKTKSPFSATIAGAVAIVMLDILDKMPKEMQKFDSFPSNNPITQETTIQVYEQISEQKGIKLDEETKNKVINMAYGKAKAHIKDGFYNYGLDQFWVGFASNISFLRDVCELEGDYQDRFAIYEALVTSCGWTWWHDDVFVVSDRMLAIRMDDQNRLHSPDSPSIEYRDGWALYNWHGVAVEKEVIMNPQSITVEMIEKEENAEVRRVLMERYGYQRYIKDSGAEVIDECPEDYYLVGLRGAKLLRKDIPEDEPVVFIELVNSTPEGDWMQKLKSSWNKDVIRKKYLLRVDPEAYNGEAGKNCLAAVASTWRNADGSLTFSNFKDYHPIFES